MLHNVKKTIKVETANIIYNILLIGRLGVNNFFSLAIALEERFDESLLG